MTGDAASGLAQIEGSLAAQQHINTGHRQPFNRLFYADALYHAGQVPKA